MFKHIDDKGDLSLLIEHSGRFLLVCSVCKTTWFGDAKVQVPAHGTAKAASKSKLAPSQKRHGGPAGARKARASKKKPAAKKVAGKTTTALSPARRTSARAGLLASATKTYPALFKK